MRLLLGIALVALTALAYLGARERNQRPGAAALELSPEQEVALGLQATPALAEELGGLDADPAIQRTAQEVGRRLVTLSAENSPYLFDFQVLADTRTVNAFALPGGPIFITRALYSRLDNEAELAGVLAHEIVHVVERHSAQQIARRALSTGGVVTSERARLGAVTSERARLGALPGAVDFEYERGDELAADELGVELMSAAGYDPRALISVMRLLEPSGGDSGQQGFARTHPDPGDRAARIGQAIDRRFPNGVASDLTTGRDLRVAGPSSGSAPRAEALQ